VRNFEWATVAYCTYIVAAALIKRGIAHRHRAAVVASGAAIALLAVSAPRAPWNDLPWIREWLLPGAVYLLGAYRISGLLYTRPMPPLERWLVRLDAALGAVRWSERLPLAAAEVLEFSYLSVYALIAAGPLIARAAAGDGALDPFWTIVLVADYICFGCMPWAQTRTPRALEGPAPTRRSHVRRLNLAVLKTFSHDRNTFPSGHAAEAGAVVLALLATSPAASLLFLPLALGVGIGSVAGRYHFAGDAIAGYLVSILVWLAQRRS
jgi:membrane-associated phospholipid phosphatase